MKRKTLRQRMIARGFDGDGLSTSVVRTELNRLARQINTLPKTVRRADVLALLREAKR